MAGHASPAVFFDRDDTLIACNSVTPDGDLGDPSLVQLLPGAKDACLALRRAGYVLVVVSNQGGVARGRYGTTEVDAVNDRLNELLDGAIDGFYYCPYHPKGTVPKYTREHPLRKPSPGMLLAAKEELDIDLANSWMVGNQPRDCTSGSAAGCRTILLSPAAPLEAGQNEPLSRDIDFHVASLAEVAATILQGRTDGNA